MNLERYLLVFAAILAAGSLFSLFPYGVLKRLKKGKACKVEKTVKDENLNQKKKGEKMNENIYFDVDCHVEINIDEKKSDKDTIVSHVILQIPVLGFHFSILQGVKRSAVNDNEDRLFEITIEGLHNGLERVINLAHQNGVPVGNGTKPFKESPAKFLDFARLYFEFTQTKDELEELKKSYDELLLSSMRIGGEK